MVEQLEERYGADPADVEEEDDEEYEDGEEDGEDYEDDDEDGEDYEDDDEEGEEDEDEDEYEDDDEEEEGEYEDDDDDEEGEDEDEFEDEDEEDEEEEEEGDEEEGLVPDEPLEDGAPRDMDEAAQRRTVMLLGACCCCLFIIAGVLLGILLGGGNKEKSDPIPAPTPGPTLPPTTPLPTSVPTNIPSAAPSQFLGTLFPAVADTFVRGGSFADDSYGDSNEIEIRNDPSNPTNEAFAVLEFGLPNTPPGSQVFLRLQHVISGNNETANIVVERLPYDPAVDIEALTFNNYSLGVGQVGPTFEVNDETLGTLVEVDITSLFPATPAPARLRRTRQLQQTGVLLRLITTDDSNLKGELFRSRQFSAAEGPVLSVFEASTSPSWTPSVMPSSAPSISSQPTAPTVSPAPSLSIAPSSLPSSTPSLSQTPTTSDAPTTQPSTSASPSAAGIATLPV